MEYFSILIVILLVTVILEKTYNIHLYKNRRERLFTVALFFIVGIVWDSFAIWQGDWVFPQGKNLGMIIGVMPLEEYLFILIIPYAVITIYKVIDIKFAQSKKKRRR